MKMVNLFKNIKHVRRINCNWQGVKDCEVSEICVMVMFAKKRVVQECMRCALPFCSFACCSQQ